jgi:post-segregation antitoxin (ccd killing protein)
MQLMTHQVASCSTLSSSPSNTASRTGRSRTDSINVTVSVASAGLRAASHRRRARGWQADDQTTDLVAEQNMGIEYVQETGTATATVDRKF